MEMSLTTEVLLWGFGIAVVMGAIVNKTNFCTMGAISDWVVMRDTGRLRSWALAATVAMLGMVLLESLGVINLDTAYPAYRRSEFIWVENLLGGILFGIGMTLASGCGSKLLVRIGGGNFKSIIVVGVIGIVAYYMGNPLPGTDKTLYSLLFHGWLLPTDVVNETGKNVLAVNSHDRILTSPGYRCFEIWPGPREPQLLRLQIIAVYPR